MASFSTLSNKKVLIFAIHRTINWWRYLGEQLGCLSVLSSLPICQRGVYQWWMPFIGRCLNNYNKKKDCVFNLLSEAQIVDIMARCRVLRWLKEALARI